MLEQRVDQVVGIDPDRDRLTAAIVQARTQGELARAEFPTTPGGYSRVLAWANKYSRPDRRAWSIEGAGSYEAGLSRSLRVQGEWVIEFDQPRTRAAKDGAKTDGLDALRAAREILGRDKLATPRATGSREALRALLVTRAGAQVARNAAINELRALVLTAPVELREELRHATLGALTTTCARFRPDRSGDAEVFGHKTAMRSLARRIGQLTDECAELESEMLTLVEAMARSSWKRWVSA